MGRMEIAAILMAHNVLFFSHVTFLLFPLMNILYYLLTWHHRELARKPIFMNDV